MKRIILVILMFLFSTAVLGQNKCMNSREFILPKDVGINYFCNNGLKSNYYIGDNYWTNIKILTKVDTPKIKYPDLNIKKKSYLKKKYLLK